jgi:hypothetical protein
VTAALELAAVSVAGFFAIVGVAAVLEAAWMAVTGPWRARRRQAGIAAGQAQHGQPGLGWLVHRPHTRHAANTATGTRQQWHDSTPPTEAITGTPENG